MLESEQGAETGTEDQARTTTKTTETGTEAGPDSGPAAKAAATRTRRRTRQRADADPPGSVEEPGTTPGGGHPAPTAAAGPSSEPSVAFQPPTVLFQPPDLPSTPEPDEDEAAERPAKRRRTRARDTGEPDERPAEGPGRSDETESDATGSGDDTEASGQADGDLDGEQEGGRRRRRRRGGRRRNRGDGDEESDTAEAGAEEAKRSSGRSGSEKESAKAAATDKEGAKPAPDEGEQAGDEDAGGGSGSRRRRRRRRRRGEPLDTAPDDPETTVVKVREPRKSDKAESTSVSGVEGSTRLEAKKQRRREGREAGRRRPPILTESEFLARRESVDRSMVIRQRGDITQIGVLEDKVLVEHYVARQTQTSMIGNVYLGRVQNVLPSMEAAFIDIGRGRNAVLYAGEVDWAGLGLDGQPKRIESALKSGQTVLVQVTKDPVGHKGARLTSQISLPGRYLVYVPHGSMSGISRKLPDTERSRLKQLLKDIVAEDAGVVVRTAAEGASEDELSRDVARLRAQWESIAKQAETAKAPQLLYSEPDLLIKVVRDLFTEDFSRLVVEGNEAWDMVQGYVGHVAPHLADRLERWTSPEDVFAAFRVEEQIIKALDRKVWLPSGGSLIIERTEAMTVVDVNTGKFTGSGGNLEETVTKNNLEAAEELVRQLRLRDIGGIIVVDFIDMVLESNRELVLRRLVECLGRDRTKHQVAEVTSLGLVQMTRKRIGTGLLESFSEPCEACKGRGHLVHLDPLEVSGETGKGSVTNGSGKRGGGSGGAANGASNGTAETGEEDSGRRSRRRRGRGGGGEGSSSNGSGEAAGKATGGESGDEDGAHSAEPAAASSAEPTAEQEGLAPRPADDGPEGDDPAALADGGPQHSGPGDAAEDESEETPAVRDDKDYASVSESLEPSVEPLDTKEKALTAAAFSSSTRPRRRF